MEFLGSGAATIVQTAATPVDAWHRAVPTLQSAAVTLREIKASDARSLLAPMRDPGVTGRHYPQSLAGMQKFAREAREHRKHGRLICFVIIPEGQTTPVGVIQLRPIKATRSAAEFEVIIGRSFQNDSLFQAAVALMFQFAFGALGVSRLESGTIVAGTRPSAPRLDAGGPRARLRIVKR